MCSANLCFDKFMIRKDVFMSTHKRTAARRSRHGTGRLLLFATLLSSVALFTIAANASAEQPTTVIASGFGSNTVKVSLPAMQQPERVSPLEQQFKSVNTSEQTPEKTDTPVNHKSEDWMLTLVNADHPLPDDYSPNLKLLTNGLRFDERAIEQLNAMLSAARAEGLSPVVCSAYRSIEYQGTLFRNQVTKQMSKGLSREQAEMEARKVVAYPGTSEHNLGLAADIVSFNDQLLNDAQADTPEVKWLLEHCHEYGFILRYPKDKTDITGIIYEPWHFRYVGVEAATEIMESGLCLEEYLAG